MEIKVSCFRVACVVFALVIFASDALAARHNTRLLAGGTPTTIKEFPYSVAIYRKIPTQPGYEQICGGSLISANLVVSAAHCFWDVTNLVAISPEHYAVAVGTTYREWIVGLVVGEPIQQRNISSISFNSRFFGFETGNAYDIAVLTLDKDVIFTDHVKAVEIDWFDTWTKEQLVNGKNGTVTGWGLDEDNNPSKQLRFALLPYVDPDTCIQFVDREVKKFVTHDKFCAGYINKSISICSGDSGGGLVFFDPASNKRYLRGVSSIAFEPEDRDLDVKCFSSLYTAFVAVDPDVLRSLIKTPTLREVQASECGRQPVRDHSGGAVQEPVSWHAGVFELDAAKGRRLLCAGTLITTKLVISDATCFLSWKFETQDFSGYQVSLGMTESSATSEQIFGITKVSVPKQCNVPSSSTYDIDFAIIQLDREATLTSTVSLVCIDWSDDFEYKQLREDSVGYIRTATAVPQWGTTTTALASTLKWTAMPYVPLATCTAYAQGQGMTNKGLTSLKFCAQNMDATRTICRGDFGGGYYVVDPITERYYLRGIFTGTLTSFGNWEVCYADSYRVSTRIAPYLGWIREIMATSERPVTRRMKSVSRRLRLN